MRRAQPRLSQVNNSIYEVRQSCKIPIPSRDTSLATGIINGAHSPIERAGHRWTCLRSMTVYTQTKVTFTHNTPILVSLSWIIAAAVSRKTAYPTALELAYSSFNQGSSWLIGKWNAFKDAHMRSRIWLNWIWGKYQKRRNMNEHVWDKSFKKTGFGTCF